MERISAAEMHDCPLLERLDRHSPTTIHYQTAIYPRFVVCPSYQYNLCRPTTAIPEFLPAYCCTVLPTPTRVRSVSPWQTRHSNLGWKIGTTHSNSSNHCEEDAHCARDLRYLFSKNKFGNGNHLCRNRVGGNELRELRTEIIVFIFIMGTNILVPNMV